MAITAILVKKRFWLLILPFLLVGCGGGIGRANPSPTIVITGTAAGTATLPPSQAAATQAVVTSETPLPAAASTLTATPPATSTITDAPTPPAGPLSGKELVDALRNGGYVIFFRHAATDPTPDDANPVVLDDCGTQRNLSAQGQEQARAIGQAFQRLEIPVGRVLASPFCRTLDTARLAFGQAEPEPDLENLETSPDDAERERRTAGLRQLLAATPDPGTNTVLVAHGFNINAVTQVSLGEGGAAVFRPDGAGGYSLVATVPAADWALLEP